MPKKPHQGPGFWSEIKRRGVHRVVTMYAATAFIIMDAVDIMLPRLGLPEWTVTLVIVLLIAGLPIAIILSWIFDITSHGVVKTEPFEAVEPSDDEHKIRRRRFRLSDGVIALLLAVVVILIYPRIFHTGRYALPRGMRGNISIAVMPFKNMTGDTLFNLWQEGLQNLMITSLSNSQELSVRQYETMNSILKTQSKVNYASMTPSLAGELARKLDANTVISGSMYNSAGKLRITANILDASTEEIYKSYEMEGDREDDFFALSDSLSLLIRNFLEIRNIEQQQNFDLKNVFTSSADAYKLYLLGYNCHSRLDYEGAADYYGRAIEVDSNFVSAMMKLAYVYGDTRQAERSKYWAYKAFDQIGRLTPDMQFLVKAVKATVDKKPYEQITNLEQYLEVYPQSMNILYTLGWVNFNMERWPEAIVAFEKSHELFKKIDQNSWAWSYLLLGRAYHFTGEHKKEQKIFTEGKESWPDQKLSFDYWQAVCAVSQGDSADASYYLDEIRKMTEQYGWPEANRLLWYAGVYEWGESNEKAEQYLREALLLRPGDEMITYDLAEFLISKEINLDEGMELIRPLVEKYPENVTYLYTYGMGLYKMEKYREAEEVLQKSWELRPYYDHQHFTLLKKVNDLVNRG
jgi:tetratricopeptide (TPR) repeat protein